MASCPRLVHKPGKSRRLGGEFTWIGEPVQTHRRIVAKHLHEIGGTKFFLVPDSREVGESKTVFKWLQTHH